MADGRGQTVLPPCICFTDKKKIQERQLPVKYSNLAEEAWMQFQVSAVREIQHMALFSKSFVHPILELLD